ncbi:Malate dehydrogenase 2, partial [Durusdinium trenchii]
VYDTLDSQDFLLPQRRHRVWGIASVITGKDTLEDLEQRYKLCLASMRSNAQLPMELNFPPAPKQPIQAGRQQKLLAKAKELRPTSKNLFLDCSSSLKRIAFADGVCPCITPTHPIYSQAMERYLNSQDILNGQGLWRSCYNDAVYDQMLEKCAESLSGNSFSSTVVQAVSLACFISCPSSWDTVLSSQKLVKPDQGAGILRRLKRKQPAPEYDHCRPRLLKEQQPPLEHGRGKVIGADTKKQMVRVKKRLFKRKNPDMDSRKFNKGKKACSSIWQKEQQWTVLCSTAPRLMQRCKEVPNNLRKVLGLPKKFLQRRSTESNELSAIMPSALETAAERAERGEEINYHFVADVLKIGIEQYNHAVIKLKEELADPVKLLAMLEDHVQNLPEGASEECINKELGKARDRICSRLTEIGWRESSGNFGEFHERMIANFDQVWSLLFRPAARNLMPKANVDPDAKQRSFRHIRHCLERTLGLPYTESFDKDKPEPVKESTITGSAAANVAIEGWRIPRTLCTLSWADGSVGRGFITVREGCMSQADRTKANQELKRWIYVGPLQQKTHIWSGTTMQRYLSFLAEEIRERRRRLSLDHSARCLVHPTTGGTSMFMRWCTRIAKLLWNGVIHWIYVES